MKLKIINIMKMMIIEFINGLVRLVSITPGHVKLDWLPPPKVDRVNKSDKDDNNNKNEDE